MVTHETAVVFMVKNYQFEPVKTRFAKDLNSPKAAFEIYDHLMKITTEVAFEIQASGLQTYFAINSIWGPWLVHPNTEFIAQGPGGLGSRLGRIHLQLGQKFKNVIFLGSDLPTLSFAMVQQAVAQFKFKDFVIGPSKDGGFYLFGARGPSCWNDWESIVYSQRDTLLQIKNRLPRSALHLLDSYSDVDDLTSLTSAVSEMARLKCLSGPQVNFFTTSRKLILDLKTSSNILRISPIDAFPW